MTRASFAFAALLWALVVAHLLFIPYAYSPLSWEQAVARFAQTQWAVLGSDQNVALASRALMFMPLGMLLAGVIAPLPKRFSVGALVFATLGGSAWAIGVNFMQLWFPNRTVNINNMVAEIAGVAAGALSWTILGSTLSRWRERLGHGGLVSLRAALSAYVVLYFIASMTPFDFVSNAAELSEKLHSGLYGWWLAPLSCGPAPCRLKFAAAALLAIPCGWWIASRQPAVRQPSLSAVLVAFTIAVFIEALHLLMVSGVSQGASILTRTAGMVFGVATYGLRYRAATTFSRAVPAVAVVVIVPYLLLVAYVAGWLRAPMLPVSTGMARIHEIIWLPFNYQYFAPYQSTMQSAIVHTALYMPVGVLCWALARARDRVSLWAAALAAGLLAFSFETSEIFLAGRLPDYTNVLIAVVAATATLFVLRFVSGHPGPPLSSSRSSKAIGMAQPVPDDAPAPFAARLVGVLFLVIAVATVWWFPVGRLALFAGLTIYAIALTRAPWAYLLAIPALLPVLDLAPVTGRFFWDEFDALLAVTLGTRLMMPMPERLVRVEMPRAGFLVLGVSLIASTAVALWPPSPLDFNAFTSYLSSYNALRVLKGYAWAGALVWLFARDASSAANGTVVAPSRILHVGLALAFVTTAISVIIERVMFVSGFDVTTFYRASGFVSATHVGGAYTEALLVGLAPFALALAIESRTWLIRMTWLLITVTGAVAVVATLSRAATAAWLIEVSVFAVVWLLGRRSSDVVRSPAVHALVWCAVLVVVAVPAVAMQSTFLRDRLAASSGDLAVRVAHWKDSMSIILRDPLHIAFGMGVGRFPRDFYQTHAFTDQLPAYRIDRGASPANVLVLTGGRRMYMDQRIGTVGSSELRFTGRVRTNRPEATLVVLICEKSLLNSTACQETQISVEPAWRSVDVRLRVPANAQAAKLLQPPLTLSLHNPAYGTRIELTDLHLINGDRDLLHNGSFEHGLDYWFITSDEHLAWRVHNTPLQIAFEQGIFGALAWLLIAAALIAAAVNSSKSAAHKAAIAASLTAWVAVSLFDTLFDAPRIIIVFGLVLALTFARRREHVGQSVTHNRGGSRPREFIA